MRQPGIQSIVMHRPNFFEDDAAVVEHATTHGVDLAGHVRPLLLAVEFGGQQEWSGNGYGD